MGKFSSRLHGPDFVYFIPRRASCCSRIQARTFAMSLFGALDVTLSSSLWHCPNEQGSLSSLGLLHDAVVVPTEGQSSSERGFA